jgi:hypothetical protein
LASDTLSKFCEEDSKIVLSFWWTEILEKHPLKTLTKLKREGLDSGCWLLASGFLLESDTLSKCRIMFLNGQKKKKLRMFYSFLAEL